MRSRGNIAAYWLDFDVICALFILQHYDAVASVKSLAEYVPAPCTHRPSSHPSGVLVKLAMSKLNQIPARRAKS